MLRNISLTKATESVLHMVMFFETGPEMAEMVKTSQCRETLNLVDQATVQMPKWQAFDMMMELRNNGFA